MTFWLTFFSLFLLDQLLKLSSEVTLNSGISFSFFRNVDPLLMTISLTVIAVGLVIVMRWYWKQRPMLSGMLWAGIISNLFDRWVYGGAVRDWLQLPLVQTKNNLADIAISVAVTLMVLTELNQRWMSRKNMMNLDVSHSSEGEG